MASFVWSGGTGDGNFNTNGNWEGGTAPSGVGSHDITIKGAMDMTSNCNQAAMAIGTLTFTEYRGRVTDPLIFLSVTTCVAGLAAGAQVVVGSAGTIGTTTVTGDPASKFVCYSGTWTTLEASSVQFEAMSSAVVATANLALISTGSFAAGTAGTTLSVDGASRVTNYRSWGTVYCQLRSYLAMRGAAAITTKLWNFNGGTTEWFSSGTLTDVENKLGSQFITERCENSFTITNSTTAAGARFDTNAKGATITFTNPLVIRYKRLSSLAAPDSGNFES